MEQQSCQVSTMTMYLRNV